MNRQITKLAVASLILLAALIVATTYWQTWASAGLAEKQDNAIQRVAQFRIKRGLIRAADGTILATNVRRKVGGQTLYFRRYPTGRLFADLVGYSTQGRSRAGVEQSENAYLTSSNANLSTIFNKTIDRIKGVTITGNDLILSVRPSIQRLANQQLAGKCGAAVVMNPKTGKVYALASQPTYDPNLVENHFNLIKAPGAPCHPAAPLLNRATDGLFTPGSTFKVVTATAALDSHKFTPESTFYDPGYCIEYGKQVSNAASPDGPVESFGHPTLALGLQHSINSVFCNVGKALGAGTILEYMKKFGFYKDPPLETPANEKVPSGLYNGGRLFFPSHPATQVDPGRLAFGQERLAVTPLQMAMVASTIANGGVAMDPQVLNRVVDAGGHTVVRIQPQKLRRVMSPQTAGEITSMMVAAVNDGTGGAAAIPGISVAGKTGTAETGSSGINTTWFICFAPADHPQVAVAVTLENQTGFGGTTAAPIAKLLMQAGLSSRSKK
ncbi:MAG: penicillin-binding protein 2 [Actinobacteria bacterium]|nr:MAG: penicillin-binding protein 2 [Actinomycetota bacterium]